MGEAFERPDDQPFEFRHKSLIFRPLRGTNLQLQHNKHRNLGLAIARTEGMVIWPGETFSVWKLVGRLIRQKGYASWAICFGSLGTASSRSQSAGGMGSTSSRM